MKKEVYRWRLSTNAKRRLEDEARINVSVDQLLERIVDEWLASRQCALHSAAAPFIGAIRGRESRRSERATSLVRDSLARGRRVR